MKEADGNWHRNEGTDAPTGYLIWDGGKLMQEFKFQQSRWTGNHWHRVWQTEWKEVPTKN